MGYRPESLGLVGRWSLKPESSPAFVDSANLRNFGTPPGTRTRNRLIERSFVGGLNSGTKEAHREN